MDHVTKMLGEEEEEGKGLSCFKGFFLSKKKRK